MRAIDPCPVSRFNFQPALKALRASGARLVELAQEPEPFPGERRDERWADVLAYYANVAYLSHDPVDEFLMLARHLISVSTSEQVGEALHELGQAYALIEQGRRSEAGRHAVQAYELLYFAG
jgi:hypothetical protein